MPLLVAMSPDIDEPLMLEPLLPVVDEPEVEPEFMFDEPVPGAMLVVPEPVAEPGFMFIVPVDPVVLPVVPIVPLRGAAGCVGVPPLGPAAPGALLLGEPEAPPPAPWAETSPAPNAIATAADMARILDACFMGVS